jgi:hypothetical protein
MGDSHSCSGFIENPVLNISGRIIISVLLYRGEISSLRLLKLRGLSSHATSGWITEIFIISKGNINPMTPKRLNVPKGVHLAKMRPRGGVGGKKKVQILIILYFFEMSFRLVIFYLKKHNSH